MWIVDFLYSVRGALFFPLMTLALNYSASSSYAQLRVLLRSSLSSDRCSTVNLSYILRILWACRIVLVLVIEVLEGNCEESSVELKHFARLSYLTLLWRTYFFGSPFLKHLKQNSTILDGLDDFSDDVL